MNDPIVITSAYRTPIGKFNGTLSKVKASELSSLVIKHIIEETKIEASSLDSVILGHVLSGGMGQNTARQASLKASIPVTVPAYTINQVCGSGMQAIISGYNRILTANLIENKKLVVIAGGHENMSLTQHSIHLRCGIKMGNELITDMMIHDGLTDAINNVHMAVTVENIVSQYKISRQEQDEFAMYSQNKATNAQQSGFFKNEIVPIKLKDNINMVDDEGIRHDVCMDKLGSLKPAFKTEGGTITSGNASTINDGAAAVMLMNMSEAKRQNIEILGVIKSFSEIGVDPMMMGTGPVPASKKALEIAGWSIKDLDCIELNEAFAAQAIYVNNEMGWDKNKVNINGGAIALGHPIGASGARIVVTLIHALRRMGGGKGITTLCVGGGMGLTMCIEV